MNLKKKTMQRYTLLRLGLVEITIYNLQVFISKSKGLMN